MGIPTFRDWRRLVSAVLPFIVSLATSMTREEYEKDLARRQREHLDISKAR